MKDSDIVDSCPQKEGYKNGLSHRGIVVQGWKNPNGQE